MQLYSTKNASPPVSFREALFTGQAPDGGLYMPSVFPDFPLDDLKSLANKSYQELAFYVLSTWLGDEFEEKGLTRVLENAYTFAPAISTLNDRVRVIELFHGPTLSFKDFGAQFMAKSMGYFLRHEDRELTILVATSGDTGSAVAHAYHNVDGIRIVLLYPSGQVSQLQEKQFTTLGDNIMALEVDGTFDDCQALVKTAFRDQDIRQKLTMSSANSINVGRLVPQAIYYFWGVIQNLHHTGGMPVVCVPSGNFGNLCAGLFAHQMGVPVKQFIAAVNSNSVVSEYIETGEYRPRPSVRTLSNAMDVGNPSNWERIRTLYDDDYQTIKRHIWSTSVSDAETVNAMKRVFAQYNYIADPHTSVGLEAMQRYQAQRSNDNPFLVLSTAHPGKFQDIVVDALKTDFELPAALQECLQKPKKTVDLPNNYDQFKEFLWEL